MVVTLGLKPHFIYNIKDPDRETDTGITPTTHFYSEFRVFVAEWLFVFVFGKGGRVSYILSPVFTIQLGVTLNF